MSTKKDLAQRAQDVASLRELLERVKPHPTYGWKTIYHHVTQVSREGTAKIGFFVVIDGQIERVTHLFARIGGFPLTDFGLRVGFLNMNQPFAVTDAVMRQLGLGGVKWQRAYKQEGL